MDATTDAGERTPPPEPANFEQRPAGTSWHAPLIAQAVRAVGAGEVDALFVSDAAGRRLITLNGADRAYRLLVEDIGGRGVDGHPRRDRRVVQSKFRRTVGQATEPVDRHTHRPVLRTGR